MSLLTLFDDDTFSPSRLFLPATIGNFWGFDDFAYLSQKADGSVPVTALEQPVGLVKGQRNGLTSGSELTPGTFAGYTNVSGLAFDTITATAGSLYLKNNTEKTTAAASAETVSVVAGRYYWFEANVTRVSGSYDIGIRASAGGGFIGTPNSVSATITTNGTVRFGFFASVTDAACAVQVTARAGSGEQELTVTSVSLRELPGIHWHQPTDAARPVISARYNLLLATATLSTQSVTTLAASYTLTFTGTGTVTLSGTATGINGAGSNVFTATAGTLTLTVSGDVTLADLRLTADANPRLPAYQRVTTATDYDSVGFPRFLRIDATDDFMQTAPVDPGTDKVFVCGGVTKMSDAAAAILLESSAAVSANTGAFAIRAPGNAGANYYIESKGTVIATAITAYSFAAPTTAVASLIGDISGDSAILRVNGAVRATATVDQGTGNFIAQPIYIGARAGTSQRLNNGRIYPMVICFKAVTAGEIAATEAWVNSKVRAF